MYIFPGIPVAGISADSGCLQASFYNNEFLEAVRGNVSNHYQSTLYPGTDVLVCRRIPCTVTLYFNLF